MKTNKTFKRSTCSLVISSILATFAVNADQETSNTNSKDATQDETEVIRVVGIRGSILTAQDLKKNANTVKDVISSDDIGALPDKSVTEALMRVPGVTIERFASSDDPNHFAAEGTGVVVRGLKRVRSEINGRDSFSASTYGGGLSYQDIPGELLGSVEVVKNTTADLIAGGVAGTVNLVTRKPFDFPEMQLMGTVKASHGDHRGETTPVFSGIFSNRWKSDLGEFGVLFSGAASEYEDRGDGVSVDNYYERSNTAAEMPQFGYNGTALANYPDQTLYVPANVNLRSADSIREREGMSATLQYRSPDNSIEITAEHISSNAKLSWDERVVQYGEQGFNVNPNVSSVENAQFNDNGFMTSGTVFMGARSIAQSRWRATENDVEDTSLHLTYYPMDALRLDFDIQKIESYALANDYTINSSFANDDFSFNLAGEVPSVNYLGPNLTAPLAPAPGTVSELYINSAMDKEDDVDAELTAYAADLEYEIDDEWFTSVQAGVYASNKKQTIRDSLWNWGEVSNGWQSYDAGGQASAYQGTDEKPGHPELYEEYTFNANEFHGGGVLPSSQSFLFAKFENVHNWIDYHAAGAAAGYSTFVPLRNRGCVTLSGSCDLQGAYLPSEISSAEEDRLEFYVQGNFENDTFFGYPVKGNFGLRYISWQVESTGATQFPTAIPGWDAARIARYDQTEIDYQNSLNGNAVTIKGSEYTKVLPSFNISAMIDDGSNGDGEKIIRFALSQNVFMPNFADFRYFRTITESHREVIDPDTNQLVGYDNITFDGVTGNPNIKPEEALNIDITYEWYINNTDSLTFSLFSKRLDNIIRQRLFIEDVTNPLQGVTTNDDGTTTLRDPVTKAVNFQTTTNEGSGTINGFELAYTQFFDSLPEGWNGLGAQFNFTYLNQSNVDDSKGFGEGSGGAGGRNRFRAFKNLDLPGYSDQTVNVTLMYEKYDVSARLAYNWRSEYLLTRRDADLFAPVIADSTGQLDASVAYSFNDNFKVGLEASNLLDEVITTRMMYNQAGQTTPRSHFKTDRRFGAYLSYKF